MLRSEDVKGSRTSETVAELVAANHVLAMLGLVDAFGHISMRANDNTHHFLMARSMAPALVTEADIIRLDLDSRPLDEAAGSASIERFIHGEIYKARPDVMSVVHTHSPTIIPFSVSRTPLRPVSHVGAFLSPEVPVYDTRDTVGASNLLISDNMLGRALAEKLGLSTVVLIRGHGNAVVAPTIGMAVYRAYFTEKGAELLMQARQLDGPIAYVQPDEAELANSLRNNGYVRQWELWKEEANVKGHRAQALRITCTCGAAHT
jgi:HCOMODA/2-hydroxy-3-carboxy-muconic semialdehyde decarboxylase